MRSAEEGDEDFQLIHRFLAGEETAFEILLEKYYPRVARLASHILANRTAAEDIAQEVFLRAAQGLGRFRGEASLFSWLYRITVNLCLNSLHRQAAQALPDKDVALRPPPPDASRELESRQRDVLVRRALDSLPPHYRIVVILNSIEGLTYQEISDLLGIPIGTVKSRINFGKRLLRDRILPLLENSGP